MKKRKYQTGGILKTPVMPISNTAVKPPVLRTALNALPDTIYDPINNLQNELFRMRHGLESHEFSVMPNKRSGMESSGKVKSKDRFHEKQSGGYINAEDVQGFETEKLKAVQMDLKAKGLYTGKIDGIYGPKTEQAVRKYNIRSVIKKDGKLSRDAHYYDWNNSGYTGKEREAIGASPEVPPQYNTAINKLLLQLMPQSAIDKFTEYGGEYTNQKEELINSMDQGQAALNDLVGSMNERDLKGNMSPREQEIRNRLYRTVYPYGYDIPGAIESYNTNETRDIDEDVPGAEQLWSMYTGSNLYKGDKEFVKSQYTPTIAKDNAVYYDSPTLNKALSKRINKYLLGKNNPQIYQGGHDVFATVGNVKLGKGSDDKGEYISYYDIFDVNPLGDKVEINKYFNPIEIYGRIYKNDLQKQYKGDDFESRWNSTKFEKKGTMETYTKETEDFQFGGDIVSTMGYRDDSPFKDASQLTINSNNITMQGVSKPLIGIADTGETKLMKPGKNYKFKNAKQVTEVPAYKNGGILEDITNALGMVNPAIGAASAIIPIVSKLFKGPDHTVVSASPGNYQTGGDIPLSSDAFQVQGNPNVTDGNIYGNVALDHNEVVSNTEQGKFVYSDDLNHSSGKSFAMVAKEHEAAKGKAEKVLEVNPNDQQALSTISQSNAILEKLASEQEALATSMGLRNEDGTTRQNFQSGGPIYMHITGNHYYDPYLGSMLLRDPNTGKYEKATGYTHPRPAQEAINAHLKQYPAPPGFPYKDVTQILNDNQFGTGEQLGPVAPSDPVKSAAPTTAGKKASKPLPSGSNVPNWLTYGRDFMKQANDVVDGPPKIGDDVGLPTYTRPSKPEDRASMIESQASPDNFDFPPINNSNPVSNNQYKTPWTTGDYFKVAELIGKSIDAFGRPEQDRPMLDNSRITQEVYDPSAALQSNQRNFQNLLNQASGSINARRAVGNAALANKYSADNQVLSQYNSMNQQARSRYEDRVANQRRFNVQSQFRTNDINAANRAAQDAVQQNFFSSVGQFGEDLNRKRYAQDVINIFAQQYPDVYAGLMKNLG